MPEPTAAEVLSEALRVFAGPGEYGNEIDDGLWDRAITHALDELGIDPDAPLDLLFSHARADEREKAARIAEREATVLERYGDTIAKFATAPTCRAIAAAIRNGEDR